MPMMDGEEYHFCILCGGPFKRPPRIKAYDGEEVVPERQGFWTNEFDRDPEALESYLDPVDGRNVRSGELNWLLDARAIFPTSDWAMDSSLIPREGNSKWFFISGVGTEDREGSIVVPPHEGNDPATDEAPIQVELERYGSELGTNGGYMPMHDACWEVLNVAISAHNANSNGSLSTAEATPEVVMRYLFKVVTVLSHGGECCPSMNEPVGEGPFSPPFGFNEDSGWNVWRYTWGQERFIYLPRIEYILCDPRDDNTIASYLAEKTPKLSESGDVGDRISKLDLSRNSPRSKTPFDKLPFEIMAEISTLLSTEDALILSLCSRNIYESISTCSQSFWRAQVLHHFHLLSPACINILKKQENVDWRALYRQLNRPLRSTTKEEHNKLVKSVYDEGEDDGIDESDDEVREELREIRGRTTAEDLGDPEWTFKQPEEAHGVLGWRNRRRIFKTCQQIVNNACKTGKSCVIGSKEGMPVMSTLQKAISAAPAEAYYPERYIVTYTHNGYESSNGRPDAKRTDGPDPRTAQRAFFKYTEGLVATVYFAPPVPDVELAGHFPQLLDENLKYVVVGMKVSDPASGELAVLGPETDDSYDIAFREGVKAWIVTFCKQNPDRPRIACIQAMYKDGTLSPIPDVKFRHPAHADDPYFYPGIKQCVRSINPNNEIGIVANFSKLSEETKQIFMNFFGVLELTEAPDIATIPLRQRYKFIDAIPPDDIVCHRLSGVDMYGDYSLAGYKGQGVHLALFPQYTADEAKWSKLFANMDREDEVLRIVITVMETKDPQTEFHRSVETYATLKMRSGKESMKVPLGRAMRVGHWVPHVEYHLDAPGEIVGLMYDDGEGFCVVTRLKGEYEYTGGMLFRPGRTIVNPPEPSNVVVRGMVF